MFDNILRYSEINCNPYVPDTANIPLCKQWECFSRLKQSINQSVLTLTFITIEIRETYMYYKILLMT